MDAAVGADRHAVTQLLFGLGRPEREHDRLAAVRLDQTYSLLDAALLVRADREPEVLRLDCLGVVGEDDPATCHRDALDANEDLHRVASGARVRQAGEGDTDVAPTGVMIVTT